MLSQLTIRNFAIVESLDLELQTGMTVVSGETGAGKSIMLDALGLALGDRAESGVVRVGAERAEIVARFDLSQLPTAAAWLEAQDLDQDGECLLRRVITAEGRSRSYINGQPCPVAAVRALSGHLVDIHGQHEHQRLLKREYHRTLLDEYAGQMSRAEQVRERYQEWRRLDQELKTLTEQSEEQTARIQLLSYQTEELDQLGLAEGELEALEEEQKMLENAGQILHTGHQLLQLTADSDQENCLGLLNHCEQLLASLDSQSPALQQAAEMLSSAQIQIEEASQEVRHYLDRVEVDPGRLQQVEERLSGIYDLARKHRIQPEELIEFHQRLRRELESLSRSDEELDALAARAGKARDAYLDNATKLSQARQKAARKLARAVDGQLHELGMPVAQFEVALTELPAERRGPQGLEDVEFLITANRGQPARPLGKVASGGELSRISLAIQVITAETSSTPTLVFDEVDVGIGGAIAEVVGRKLRELGERAQILCVTHQPQVASQGHQHLFVSKKNGTARTQTRIRNLGRDDRVQEVARMLGGIDITERSMAHAREMLGLG
ncbi:DNA repair protein RecN [Marinobacterium nitratireducens]|uniref:DNA repair protein RecN n=1 Tax=Marinobacterium nitratireducens TaxID=518897 RepID=A0A918DPM1_9GAMM|nr:DNA repair protein RecN [Marinobacterium nitratireducens]GGO78513.1 DNA repair protein RecN [Marinobacterium nitratireducens]